MIKKSRFQQKKKKDNFIGRESIFELVNYKLSKIEEEDISILNLYGLGGIGKSTITREIKKRYKDTNNLVFLYDFGSSVSPLKFFENLNEFLYKNKINCVYFFMAFLIYYKKTNPNVNIKEKLPFMLQNSDHLSDILELFIDGNFIPGANIVSKYIYKYCKKANDKYFLDEDILSNLKELETLEPNEIENEISYFLGEDLKNYVKTNPSKRIIFLLDTYEKLWNIYKNDNFNHKIDEWITNIVVNTQCTNSFFVIAGREELKWSKNEPEWNEIISKKQLDVFTYEESIKLITSLGIEDEKIAHKLAVVSKGYPFYIELALDIYERDKETSIFDSLTSHEAILTRFKDNLGAKQTTILEYLSIPRKFDKKLYAHISEESNFESSESFFNELISFSFFEIDDDTYRIHSLITSSFNSSLSEDKKNSTNEILFKYYDSLIKKDYEDPLNYDEAVYHLLNIEYDREKIFNWFSEVRVELVKRGNYKLLIKLYEKALNALGKSKDLYFEFSVELIECYSNIKKNKEIKNILDELALSNVPFSLLDNIEYYRTYLQVKEKRINIKNDKQIGIDLIDKFTKIISKTEEPNIKAMSLTQSAKIRRFSKAFHSAKSFLVQALKACGDNETIKADIYDEFGLLYRDSKDYEKAIRSYSISLDIKLKIFNEKHIEIGKTYRGLGEIFSLKRDRVNASEMILKVIDIFPRFYRLESGEVTAEYKRLCGVLGKEAFVECDMLDFERKYLTLIEKDYENKNIYIDKILANTDDNISSIVAISKTVAGRDKDEAISILENADYESLTSADKYKIVLQRYLISKKRKEKPSEKEVYLRKLVEISKNLSRDRYIGELKRSAAIYSSHQLYSKSEECYLEILENINNTNYKNHLVETYEYYRKLVFSMGDTEKFEEVIAKELAMLDRYELWHQKAKALEQKVHFYRKKKIYNKAEDIYLEMRDIYIQADDLNRVDNTNGKLIQLYENNKDYDKAHELYIEQINIRKELHELVKLSKGYKFLADFYANKMDNPKEAEATLKEGLKYLLNYKEYLSPEAMNLYFVSVYNFYERFQPSRTIEILDFRLEYIENNPNTSPHLKIGVYDDFAIYYKKKRDFESAVKMYRKQAGECRKLKNVGMEISAMVELKNTALINNNFLEYLDTIFLICIKLISIKKYEPAIKFLAKAIEFHSEKKIVKFSTFQKKYNEILLTLVDLNRLEEYSDAIILMGTLNDEFNLYGFYRGQAKTVRKTTDSVALEKIAYILSSKKEKFIGSFYYYEFIDRRLEIIRAKYDLQEEFYIECTEKLREFKNYKLLKEHKERYERFKIRMAKFNIINGRAVDGIILNTINQIEPISIEESRSVLIEKLKEYTELYFIDEEVIQKAHEGKLASSVFTQGFSCIIKDYDTYLLGVNSNEYIIRYLLTDSSYKLTYINGHTPIIIKEDEIPETSKKAEDIEDLNHYVHSVENYKDLLYMYYREKEKGVYFPTTLELMKNVLSYLGDNSIMFTGMKYTEIVGEVLEKFNFEKVDDTRRVENIVKNLCVCNILEEDFSYKEFEEKLFSLNCNYEAIVRGLKDSSYQVLESIVEDVNIINFEKIYLPLTNRDK